MKYINKYLSIVVLLMLCGFILAACDSGPSSPEEEEEIIEGPSEEVALRITTTSLPDGEVGTAYSDTLMATGGDGNYVWEIATGDLPEGLSLNTATGEISGDPTVDGSFNFTTEVSSAGITDSKSFSIEMLPPIVTSFRNAVINVDFMDLVNGEAYGGDEVYVGDDGVFSSKDGTFWNPGASGTENQITGAMDEFGQPTYVEMVAKFNGTIFIGAAINELQDTGVTSASVDASDYIIWRELLADNVYDLAIYVHHESSIERFTTLNVTHAGGTITLSTTADATWVLPGEEDQDYLLLENVNPYEITDGVYGFRIDNINGEGAIVGLQLKGLMPVPGE